MVRVSQHTDRVTATIKFLPHDGGDQLAAAKERCAPRSPRIRFGPPLLIRRLPV